MCPGCGTSCGDNVCCDPCWDRLPVLLPWSGRGSEGLTWRRRLASARMIKSWRTVELILEAIRRWLKENPVIES